MNPSFQVYALCLVVLSFKMTGIGYYQGYIRTKTKSFVNPEDARTFVKGKPAVEEAPEVERANKAYRNDLENIPMFLFLALAYIQLECWETGAIVYFSTFTMARIFHTISYLRGLQPWRTISYTVGGTMSFIVAIHILIKVLG